MAVGRPPIGGDWGRPTDFMKPIEGERVGHLPRRVLRLLCSVPASEAENTLLTFKLRSRKPHSATFVV